MFPTEIAKIIVSYIIGAVDQDVYKPLSWVTSWTNWKVECMSCYNKYEYCKWKDPSGDIMWMDFCDRDTIRCGKDALYARRVTLVRILTSPFMKHSVKALIELQGATRFKITLAEAEVARLQNDIATSEASIREIDSMVWIGRRF